jgi:alkaline phosphatase D
MRQRAISGLSRREVINRALTLAAAGLTAPYAGPVSAAPRLCCSPFKLGVASGDPHPDGVVLWTRLALDLRDGEQWGLPERAYTLRWEVRDPALPGTPLVKHGAAIASADKAYAVHVEVTGLQPSRAYLYRFILGDYFDEGFTRTAPARGAMPESLRFAFCSCAEFENAYHYAYKLMADEKPEFIVHLGDYIYEQTYDEHYQYDSKRGPKKEEEKNPPASRSECPEGATPVWRTRKLQFDRVGKLRELAQYRRRYAEYKLDKHLQAAHRNCPFIVTWDDHEVDNDYAGERSAESEESGFVQRRMNAYRAYFENLPLRLSALPQVGNGRRLYRHFDFGGLMRLHMLDERQYRSPQACPKNKLEGKGRFVPLEGACKGQITDAVDAKGRRREMLGQEQEQWLAAQLAGSEARWNVLAQGVMMAHIDLRADCQFKPAEQRTHVLTDSWSGYIAARQRVIDLMDRYGAKNPVVLGGDVHCHFANKILKDWADPKSMPVAPEFVCTAISSFTRDYSPLAGPNGGNTDTIVGVHGKYNGYVVCDVSKDEFRVAMVEVDAKRDTIGDKPGDVHRYVVHAGKHTPEVA